VTPETDGEELLQELGTSALNVDCDSKVMASDGMTNTRRQITTVNALMEQQEYRGFVALAVMSRLRDFTGFVSDVF